MVKQRKHDGVTAVELSRLESLKTTENSKTEQETDWKSLYVMATLTFLSTVQVSGLITALWPYLEKMDSSADETFLGYLNSIRSIGIILAAPVTGYVSNRIESIKIPLLCGHVFSVSGILLYLSIEKFSENRKYVFLMVWLLFGFKIGIMSLSRAHAALCSSPENRAKAICITTVTPLVGTTLGPLLQLAFTVLGYPGVSFLFGTHLNMYTLPAFVGLICNLSGVVLLITVYRDPFKTIRQIEQNNPVSLDPHKSGVNTAVAVCFVTGLLKGLLQVSRASIASPYMMLAFGWSDSQYVIWHSICAAVTGLLGVACHSLFIFARNMTRKFQERWLVILGLALTLLFYMITFPWPFISKKIQCNQHQPQIGESDTTSVSINTTVYDWCSTTAAVNPIVYNLADVILVGIGTPLLTINLDVLFSKLITTRKQASMQSLFLAAGDVLQVGGPILSTFVYSVSGPTYIWTLDIIVIASCVIIWLKEYRKMTH